MPANSCGKCSATTTRKYSADSYPRNAEITSPTTAEVVSGLVNFTAYLDDDDADAIQWAVRQGTCAAGVGTVFGNVDGHSDIATIDQSDLSNQTFSFTGDMSDMTPGMYCFIYNPTEDGGEASIRETVEFELAEPEVLGCMDPNAHNYDVDANVDDGSCLYTPTSKDQCKNNGWTTFNDPIFKNQGDCVSYIQSNE